MSRFSSRVRLAAGAAALLMAGCASTPQVDGKTVADAQLRSDIIKRIENFIRIQTPCKSIIRLVVISSQVTLGPDGGIAVADETWAALTCARPLKFAVRLTADPTGGTYISVQSGRP